jgi:hyperosmotically inducible protein
MARDEVIAWEIYKKFLNDDYIKVLDISTMCYDGRVYLVGEYETKKQRKRAVAIAGSVEGVKTVTAYLLPKNDVDGCGTLGNFEMTTKIELALIKDVDIWSTNVDVKTVQCNVVLLGIVGSVKEINKSVAHAESIEGVRRVKSFLRVLGKRI